jgi:FixJ family two-component response regulator
MTIRESTGAGKGGDGGMKPRRERVLLVEDDDGVRRSIHLLLHGRGYDVRSHSSAVSLLADPGTGDARFLIADYRLLDGDGVTLLSELHARGWKGRAILITAHCTDQLRSAARACGYDLVLEKPLRQHELVAALE